MYSPAQKPQEIAAAVRAGPTVTASTTPSRRWSDWKGAYWLAFRSRAVHNSGDGDIVVLRSEDGKDWKEVKRFNVLPDDRDPQFVATDKRLFLYDPALKGPS